MDSLFSRYASALLSISREENKTKEYKDALREILEFLKEDPKTQKYLESYLVKESDSFAIVDALTKNYPLKSLANFLKVIIHKHRFHYFDKIVKEYIKLSNIELGILEGLLYSASTLSKGEIKRVQEAISKRLNKPVELRLLIDERLIGGIKVVVDEHVFDGSIQGQLNQLRESLSERR